MATETLHCDIGNHPFQRAVKRGRKPKACPECKAGKTVKKQVKKPVNKERLRDAERKYKQRVQNEGKYFKPIGEPNRKELPSGRVLTWYEGFETSEGEVRNGSLVREKGLSGQYRFIRLIVREDGTAYADLIGYSGIYTGKHRAIGVQNLTF